MKQVSDWSVLISSNCLKQRGDKQRIKNIIN